MSKTSEQSPQMSRVGALADDMIGQGQEVLSCDLNDDDLNLLFEHSIPSFNIKDGTLEFTSLEERNQFAAEFHFNEYAQKSDQSDQAWFTKAQSVWTREISSRDHAAGRLLALKFSGDETLTAAAELVASKAFDVFDALHLVEAALPYLDRPSVDALVAICRAQHEKTKNDYCHAIFFNHLEKYIQRWPDLCVSILDEMRGEIEEPTAALYSAATFALSLHDQEEAVERILVDVESNYSSLSSNALWILGRLISLKRVPSRFQQQSCDAIERSSNSETEEKRKAAIFAMASAAPTIEPLANQLTKLSASGDTTALLALSNLLFHELDNLRDHKNFEQWAEALVLLPREASVALRNFDWILSHMVENQQHELVQSCLKNWLNKNPGSGPIDRDFADTFQSTINKIKSDGNFLSEIITSWFLEDKQEILSGLASILNDLYISKMKIVLLHKPLVDDLNHDDLKLLIQHILGVVTNEDQLISLMLSLLNTKNAEKRTFGFLEEVFCREIGLDYPEHSIQELNAIVDKYKNKNVTNLCQSILSHIQEYLNCLSELPRIDELKPSQKISDAFTRARHKSIAQHMEMAEEKSVFSKLVTKIPIKAGRATFSYHNAQYSEISPLHSISHSITLPRRHVMDAVGYEISRLHYRLAKRDAE